MSKLEREALRIFATEMRAARKVKAKIIELAKHDPDMILGALRTIPREDRQELQWLKAVAERFKG